MNLLQRNVARLNNLLSTFDEFRLTSYDGNCLVIIGDFDLLYHHHFEAEFLEVSYIQCPIDFHAQTFRVLDGDEIKQKNLEGHLDFGHRVFCFQDDEQQFFISAKGFVLREQLVLHYKPSN